MKTESFSKRERTDMRENMKSLPESERPYERCARYGAKVLTDAELLAVIIRSGSMEMNSVQVARQILMKDPNHPNLTGLYYLNRKQLLEIPGIGQIKATQLQAVAELSKRMAGMELEDGMILKRPSMLAEYFMKELRYETQECVYAVFLDQKCSLIQTTLITRGTVNASLISPREIFLEALSWKAVHLVLIHNHPSGNVIPSQEDHFVTKQVREAGQLLGISLLDHIIVGNSGYYSFAETHNL